MPRRKKCDACGIRIGPGFVETESVRMEARWTLGETSTRVHTSRLRLCSHCAKAAPRHVLHLSERVDLRIEVGARAQKDGKQSGNTN